MALLSAAQLKQFTDGFIGVSNFSASGTSGNVTTAISTAVTTAGQDAETGLSVAVPLQVATATTIGVILSSASEFVNIYNNGSKKPVVDASSNEVYGKLTHTAGVYTLSYFSNIAGTETAYTFAASTAIDFIFTYRYDNSRRPSNFATAFSTRDINLAAGSVASNISTFREQLTVTATNIVSALTKTPVSATSVDIFVNGQQLDALSGGGFTVNTSTKAVTLVPANVGYDILTSGYRVIAVYQTAE